MRRVRHLLPVLVVLVVAVMAEQTEPVRVGLQIPAEAEAEVPLRVLAPNMQAVLAVRVLSSSVTSQQTQMQKVYQ